MTITLTALYTYPIKSCGALAQTQLTLGERGPLYDRQWMLTDAAGRFITQREHPRLALIQPAFAADCLTLNAPGMPEMRVPLRQPDRPTQSVVVWRDTCAAIDEGDQLAAWASDYLGTAARLVRMADDFVRQVDRQYAPENTPVGFADAFPLLLVSEASLADLNRRLVERGKTPITMSRFRPNLVVSGTEAYAEDRWRTITLGGITLDVVKPCARCATTTVDQATGTVPDTAEPLATMNTYRKQDGKVLFAQNVLHRAPGVLKVGDVVTIEEKANA